MRKWLGDASSNVPQKACGGEGKSVSCEDEGFKGKRVSPPREEMQNAQTKALIRACGRRNDLKTRNGEG